MAAMAAGPPRQAPYTGVQGRGRSQGTLENVFSPHPSPLHSLCHTVLAQPKDLLLWVSISTFAPRQRRSWE